nr:unnamed protein product [Digitaria exilis]
MKLAGPGRSDFPRFAGSLERAPGRPSSSFPAATSNRPRIPPPLSNSPRLLEQSPARIEPHSPRIEAFPHRSAPYTPAIPVAEEPHDELHHRPVKLTSLSVHRLDHRRPPATSPELTAPPLNVDEPRRFISDREPYLNRLAVSSSPFPPTSPEPVRRRFAGVTTPTSPRTLALARPCAGRSSAATWPASGTGSAELAEPRRTLALPLPCHHVAAVESPRLAPRNAIMPVARRRGRTRARAALRALQAAIPSRYAPTRPVDDPPAARKDLPPQPSRSRSVQAPSASMARRAVRPRSSVPKPPTEPLSLSTHSLTAPVRLLAHFPVKGDLTATCNYCYENTRTLWSHKGRTRLSPLAAYHSLSVRWNTILANT